MVSTSPDIYAVAHGFVMKYIQFLAIYDQGIFFLYLALGNSIVFYFHLNSGIRSFINLFQSLMICLDDRLFQRGGGGTII